jgi:hypothetical protein
MMERVTRSAAGSPMPRWGRRMLLVAAAGAGVWLLGCVGHQASAQAETASPRPVAVPNAATFGLMSSPVQPVSSVTRGPAELVRTGGVRLSSILRAGPAREAPLPPVRSAPGVVPVGRLPLPPVGSALLPPARSSKAGALPGPAGHGGHQVSEAHRPGTGAVGHRLAAPDLALVGIAAPVSPNVTAAETEPTPRPQPLPVPGPGLPLLAGGAASQTPGSPHSLPLAEPAAGLPPGPAAGLAARWPTGPVGVRQRGCLPDTPPG